MQTLVDCQRVTRVNGHWKVLVARMKEPQTTRLVAERGEDVRLRFDIGWSGILAAPTLGKAGPHVSGEVGFNDDHEE